MILNNIGRNILVGYYHTDEHGSVAAISDVDRNLVTDYDFDAFGNETMAENTYYNPMKYCGEYVDEETGLVYLRVRYYDPRIGRFISEDPIKDGLNWYVYCGNNPVMFVDPWGLYTLHADNNGRTFAILEDGDTVESVAYDITGIKDSSKKLNVQENIGIGSAIEVTCLYEEDDSSKNEETVTVVSKNKKL